MNIDYVYQQIFIDIIQANFKAFHFGNSSKIQFILLP